MNTNKLREEWENLYRSKEVLQIHSTFRMTKEVADWWIDKLESYKKDLYSKLEDMKKQHEKGFHICLEEDKVFVDADTGKKICIHRGIVEIHNKALSDAQELIK